eukprot:6369878-Amphidinium_carterae.1
MQQYCTRKAFSTTINCCAMFCQAQTADWIEVQTLLLAKEVKQPCLLKTLFVSCALVFWRASIRSSKENAVRAYMLMPGLLPREVCRAKASRTMQVQLRAAELSFCTVLGWEVCVTLFAVALQPVWLATSSQRAGSSPFTKPMQIRHWRDTP